MRTIDEPATATNTHTRRVSARAADATRPQGSTADQLDPSVIGARVKALREAADLSLRDLAARSGVSAPMLSQV
ncbi:MAG TPA: helix-turn-helix domain-containing protein, partial [Solirubrobacteraceae bacterium]|nr:helix-turn-helix domain-containing protein [Solirubrobacteraceae bacterium]